MDEHIQLTRIDATFGAEVRGVALGANLDPAVFAHRHPHPTLSLREVVVKDPVFHRWRVK